MKKAWFITHDNHIDRRIFFFTEFFIEAGFDVKLFPSFRGEFKDHIDPTYVYRPEILELVKEYTNSSGTLSAAGINGIPAPIKSDFDVAQIVDIEHAILQHIKKELFEDFNFVDNHEHIGIKSYTNSEGKSMIRAVNNKDYSIYELNKESGALYKISNIPFEPVKEDEMDGQVFDFVRYKQVIFDYSPLLTQVKRYLEREKPDIVYVADLPTLPIGIMLKKVTGCKLIIDCHEWWREQSVLWEPHLKDKIDTIDKYEKTLYKECDVHITVGHVLAESMKKYFDVNFGAIYSCLSDSLDINPDTREDGFWSKRYNIPPTAKVLLFQGSLTTLRNLENLARASFYFDESVYLAIVGGGSFEEEFRRILHKEGKPDKVIFTGWIPQEDLMNYTINSDLGIIPYVAVNDYFSMSLPNKAIEFFSACLPIICDKTLKEIANIVNDHNIGIGIDCSNPEEIGNCVNSLCLDENRLKTYKRNYLQCRDLFSYKKQSEQLSKLLNNTTKNWR